MDCKKCAENYALMNKWRQRYDEAVSIFKLLVLTSVIVERRHPVLFNTVKQKLEEWEKE